MILIFEKTVFAQNSKNIQPNETITIAEFCSLNLNKEISVKIQDELSLEKIHNLMSACTGDEKGKIGPIDLDLSNCTFKNKGCNIFITNLKNVRFLILPKTTKIITFCLASDMEHIILPDGLERIEEQAFFRTKLKSIEIPESVQYVGALAFGDIENLQYIKIFNNPHKTKWSSIWNKWNDAKYLKAMQFFFRKKMILKKNTVQFDFQKLIIIERLIQLIWKFVSIKSPGKIKKPSYIFMISTTKTKAPVT